MLLTTVFLFREQHKKRWIFRSQTTPRSPYAGWILFSNGASGKERCLLLL